MKRTQNKKPSNEMDGTIGQAINQLITQHGLYQKDVAKVLKVNGSTLGKIIRGQKELSFLMAVRLMEWFDLSVDQFLSMLSKEEINRQELTTIKYFEKQELRKAMYTKTKAIEVKDMEEMNGAELTALVMSHIQNDEKKKQMLGFLKTV